jgi:hypothetical protein
MDGSESILVSSAKFIVYGKCFDALGCRHEVSFDGGNTREFRRADGIREVLLRLNVPCSHFKLEPEDFRDDDESCARTLEGLTNEIENAEWVTYAEAKRRARVTLSKNDPPKT